MIFPIQAINKYREVVQVDYDNPEHEKYAQKGETVFYEDHEINGIALGYEIFDVKLEDGSIVAKEFVLFAEEVDDMIGLSFIDMSHIRISPDRFDKKLKDAQTA